MPFRGLVLFCLLLAVAGFALYVWFQVKDLPDVSVVERIRPNACVEILDRHDQLVCTIEDNNDHRVVPLSEIPAHTRQSVLAAEDHHFYDHPGIHLQSILRAILSNVQAGKMREGGSTITQQLAKNLFFGTNDKSPSRKIREAFLAIELERRYSKDRILELYLNQIYFGNGAWGIDRAAYRYFNKKASQLGLAESAFLAAVIKAPSELGDPRNRKAAIARQRLVLDNMVEYGYLTPETARKAKKQTLAFKKGFQSLERYPHYISYVLELVKEKFSAAEMKANGLRVYTWLDPKAQEMAEEALSRGIAAAPAGIDQGAMVSLDVFSGGVIALVGNAGEFWKNQWNCAVNPHTVGSAIKPFVYLTAFRTGQLHADSLIDDAPLSIRQNDGRVYCPKNFDSTFMGPMPVRRALALSRNTCAVRAASLTGIDKVIETLALAGIKHGLENHLAIALGSPAISPLNLANAYATLARNGTYLPAQLIRRIEDKDGNLIEMAVTEPVKVFEPNVVAELVDALQDVVRIGTGRQALLPERPVAGKTGTTDGARDIWFVGFTPDLVTAAWAGNAQNRPVAGANVTGGSVMAKIWRQYTKEYYLTHAVKPLSFPTPNRQAVAQSAETARTQLRELENNRGSSELVETEDPPSDAPASHDHPPSESAPFAYGNSPTPQKVDKGDPPKKGIKAVLSRVKRWLDKL